jgi:hypothetical protein
VAGTASVPNVIGAQPGGSIQASLFDANWNAITAYINAREIGSGSLAGRPTAGVSGRFYFATDVGILFFDTGAAWTTSSVVGGTAYTTRNLVGQNDVGAPNTKFGFSADLVVLRSPADGSTISRTNTGTLTNDTGAASVVNGRDQGAAFGASTWIHFYFIWNGSVLGTLSSLVPPPVGPTLPGGYTHWAYAGAVRYNATPLLVATYMRGSWMYYQARQTAVTGFVTAVETALDLSALVPPNALTTVLDWDDSADQIYRVRVATGVDYFVRAGSATATQQNSWNAILPNVSQQILHLFDGGVGTGSVTVLVNGFSVPNGGA